MKQSILSNELIESENQFTINSFLNQLKERIKVMESTLIIDRIEGNIAVCENRETSEIININKSDLPIGVKDGSVLTYKNGKYEIDEKKQEEIQKRIEEKMKKIWNN